jgi:FixJ family two-component response regulator
MSRWGLPTRVALAAFQQNPGRYDIVLTDERMPMLRGAELGKLIRAIDPHVPIIITGHRDSDLEQRAEAAGVAEVLDKPLRAQLLRDALERQLAAAARQPTSADMS